MHSKNKSMLFPGCDFRDLGRALQRNNPIPPESMKVKDDRTSAQLLTHTRAVVARDPGMSGWGLSAGGVSYCIWACAPGVDVAKVLAWVQGRSDMEGAQAVDLNAWDAPEDAKHVHIYVCTEGHPGTL